MYRLRTTLGLTLVVAALFSACAKEAEIVVPNPIIETDTGTGITSLYPQIQAMYPGSLQTVPAPPPPTAGITRDGAAQTKVILAFTRTIDIASITLNDDVELYQGAIEIGFASMTPGAHSRTFVLTTNALAASTTYTVRIYRTLYEAGDPTSLLDFSNLGTLQIPPGDTYVEYSFTTSAAAPGSDTTPPVLTSIDPANGAANVPITLDTGTLDGYTSIVFDKTVNPVTLINANLSLQYWTGAAWANFPDGWTIAIDTSDVQLRTYRLYPNGELAYNTQYRHNISIGNTIQDINGNLMVNNTTNEFTTLNFAASTITNYIIEQGSAADRIRITWYTSTPSITNVAIDDGPTFVAAVQSYSPAYPTEYDYYHSHEFAGLTRNEVYSVRIIADSNPAETNDHILTLDGVFRTTPTAAQNSQLAVAASNKSSLRWSQIDQNRSYVVYRDSGTPDIRAQFINTGAIQWGANGTPVFASDGSIESIPNNSDGIIVTRSDGTQYIYAANIRHNAGLESVWGAPTQKTIYNAGGATTLSAARISLTYSGYVTVLTSGTANLNYLHDSTLDFSSFLALDAGDHIINEAQNLHTTISAISAIAPFHFLQLNADIISAGNLGFRIGDNDITESGIEAADAVGTTITVDVNSLDNGDMITNGTNYTYLTSGAAGGGPYTYTTAINSGFVNTNPLTTYDYITNGTADTNTLYDPLTNFSTVVAGGILLNDITINTDNGTSDKISSISAESNGLLLLATAGTFLFDTAAADAYSILRLPDHTTLITSGISTGFAGNDVTQAGRQFITTDGVQVGDIVFNIPQNAYARITSRTEDTLTLSQQVFTGIGQSFIVIRFSGLTFVWAEGNEIFGKTVNNSNGSPVLPDALATGKFTITDNANSFRNPHIVSDTTGNAIVIYEMDAGGGTWNIRAKKIRSDGAFVWGGGSAADGTVVANAITPSAGKNPIVKVVENGAGGAWVLYHTSTSIALVHITDPGVVTLIASIATAYNPDMAILSTNSIGIAYEMNTTVGTEVFRRIYARVYDNTPANTGLETHVRPGGHQAYNQINPRIGPDGSGGCIISWLETKYMSSIYYALFAQHFDGTLGTNYYGDDRFVAIPVRSDQSANPYLIEHAVIRYNDGTAPNAGLFFWLDERAGAQIDIYFQQIADL